MNATSLDLLAPRRRAIHESLGRFEDSLVALAHLERDRPFSACTPGGEQVRGAVEGAQGRFEACVREKALRSLSLGQHPGAPSARDRARP